MSKVQGKAWDGKLFRRVLAYTKPYSSIFAIALSASIILAIMGPLRIHFINILVEDYIGTNDKHMLAVFTGLIIAMLLVETVLQFFYAYLSSVLGESVIKDLRVQLFGHITKLRLKYFDNNPIGMLVTRAVSDMETISQIFSQGLLAIIGDSLKVIVALGFMIYTDWKLTLFVLIPIPILFIATSIFKKAIKKSFQDVRTQISALNTFVQERVTGMALVKVFGREKREARAFSEINEKHKKANIRSIWAYSIFFPVVEILSALSLGLLFVYILMQFSSSETESFPKLTGLMFAFIFYINMLFRPIRMLADRFNTLQMGMVGADRVFKVLDTEETILNNGTADKVEFKGNIKFEKVFFAYEEPKFVLKNLSFEVKEGETVAFVGATGAGKTSIINLLGRFYEFQKGEILIDGHNLRDISTRDIRKNISVVLQDVFLYNDTILNNITLGNNDISRDSVIEAAKLVGAHDFIANLPEGYDFNVKERGGLLSVGQRQLISFIRAYVYQPKILILDEATSSIDTESELMIQNAIEKLTKGRTSIVIAHRLSTIRNADKIIVLEQGELIEMGSHSELIQIENGAYRKLYDYQFDENA